MYSTVCKFCARCRITLWQYTVYTLNIWKGKVLYIAKDMNKGIFAAGYNRLYN